MLKQNDPRQFDKAVARLRGLDVLGEAPCYWQYKNKRWIVATEGMSNPKMQPVYLQSCVCEYKTDHSAIYFGHIGSCLAVVPFYHQDRNLAVDALEQVCGERKLTPLARLEFGKWAMELYDSHACDVAQGDDPSLALAICKALAELENKK